MKILDVLTTVMICLTVVGALFSFVKAILKYRSRGIKVTNRKTGKSVVLGKHHQKDQAKRLLEVVRSRV